MVVYLLVKYRVKPRTAPYIHSSNHDAVQGSLAGCYDQPNSDSIDKRGRAAAARLLHGQKVTGSSPVPATITG